MTKAEVATEVAEEEVPVTKSPSMANRRSEREKQYMAKTGDAKKHGKEIYTGRGTSTFENHYTSVTDKQLEYLDSWAKYNIDELNDIIEEARNYRNRINYVDGMEMKNIDNMLDQILAHAEEFIPQLRKTFNNQMTAAEIHGEANYEADPDQGIIGKTVGGVFNIADKLTLGVGGKVAETVGVKRKPRRL